MTATRRPFTKSLSVLSSILAIILFNQSFANDRANSAVVNNAASTNQTSRNIANHLTKPKIQLAILLDTSSSMDGLIDQARNQLWQVVNEFSTAKQNGIAPILEVAVYEYGNDNLSPQHGHTRQVINLTSELDQVSEALFSLTTNGGNEYCGYAIGNAVSSLQWSTAQQDIKAIFIAGNEPFTQGPVPFKKAVSNAKLKGIVVNTIHAGTYEEGAQSGWQQGAILAGGDYMSINHNQQVAHIIAPQDKKIAELNQQLNQTYIPYGSKGIQSVKRQQAQDEKSQAVSLGLLAKRTQSKTSSLYNNANWDLVDAVESGSVKLDLVKNKDLPPEMKNMDTEHKKVYLETKTRERTRLKAEITHLGKARNAYVNEKKAEKTSTTTADNMLDEALISAVRKQGRNKNFIFSESTN